MSKFSANDKLRYYHQLFQVEATVGRTKSDLKATPVFHRKRDAIEAHLTIVLAVLVISRNIEYQTKMSIKQFVKLLHPLRCGMININGNELQVQPEIPVTVKALLNNLNRGH